VVEHLASICEALGLIPSTEKKKKGRKAGRKEGRKEEKKEGRKEERKEGKKKGEKKEGRIHTGAINMRSSPTLGLFSSICWSFLHCPSSLG
jgi:hypothetical protein